MCSQLGSAAEMTRRRLANRRPAVLVGVEHQGAVFTVCAGLYSGGQVGEVFVSGARSGSDLAALVDDGAVLASIALQYGAPLEVLARAMGRHNNRTPASVLGCALDRVVELLDEERG